MVSFATGDGNAELRVDNAGPRAENPAPKRKLGTDSSNSPAPPSRDSLAAKGKRRARRSQRVWSKAGSQWPAGRNGSDLVPAAKPDRTETAPVPQDCSGCGADLVDGTDAGTSWTQIWDTPATRLKKVHYLLAARRSRLRCAAAEGFGRSGRLGPPLETAPWRKGRTSTPRRFLRASAGNVPRPGRSSKDDTKPAYT
jgi:hypothetical protein